MNIVQTVAENDESGAVNAGMHHLSRLDETIKTIQQEHADYFDD